LDKNQSGFLSAATPGVDALFVRHGDGGVEAMLLKRLRARISAMLRRSRRKIENWRRRFTG